MLALLSRLAESGMLRPLDVQFSRLLAGDDKPHLALAAALVSQELAAGHVCLPLSQLTLSALRTRFGALAVELPALPGNGDEADWEALLRQENAVGEETGATPLVLRNQRLYLQRLWRDEGIVADFFARQTLGVAVDEARLHAILTSLFPVPDAAQTDWQRVAAAVAVTRRVAVISGGPGTGKTTTVARLLAALLQLRGDQRVRIQLAAPTGKAAARLTESLGSALNELTLPAEVATQFPREAFTLHRLLGAQPDSIRMRHHRNNPLHLDVLVVDEASMVDLPMMSRLIEALPQEATLILLGDRDQLASVEAGAVLGDICRFAEYGFRSPQAVALSRLCDTTIDAGPVLPDVALRDALCLLQRSYRFDASSGIGNLARAINAGSAEQAQRCLAGTFSDVVWHVLEQPQDYQRLIEQCVEGYRTMLLAAADGQPALQVLAEFTRFRLLCALREGPLGQQGLNLRIEQALARAGLIQLPANAHQRWYCGRPVMVTRNDSTLGLFNGDIGIALYDEQAHLRVHFQLPDGSIRSVQPSRLPQSETAYAMTVHKSQGSEFEHTLLALPGEFSPLMTRELLYTAVTRARSRLTLFGRESVFIRAIQTPTQRRSGLMERISALSAAVDATSPQGGTTDCVP